MQPRVELEPGEGNFGSRTADQIARVMRSRVGVFRACYAKEVAKRKSLRGKIVVRFEINPPGVVTKASLASSTLKSEAVETCVVTQIKRLKFPAADEPSVVSYPFVFVDSD